MKTLLLSICCLLGISVILYSIMNQKIPTKYQRPLSVKNANLFSNTSGFVDTGILVRFPAHFIEQRQREPILKVRLSVKPLYREIVSLWQIDIVTQVSETRENLVYSIGTYKIANRKIHDVNEVLTNCYRPNKIHFINVYLKLEDKVLRTSVMEKILQNQVLLLEDGSE
jgi:hypothetical protein